MSMAGSCQDGVVVQDLTLRKSEEFLKGRVWYVLNHYSIQELSFLLYMFSNLTSDSTVDIDLTLCSIYCSVLTYSHLFLN